MKRYLDPKNDLPFKRVFGEHPELLKSFLNALMPFEEGKYIESLEYLPAEQVPDNPAKKSSIVDVRCKDNNGRQFIVEMQMYWNTSFSNRMVFNASKAYVRQLDKGEHYELLQPVYGLGIINDIFDNKTPEYYHHYKTVNCKNSTDVIKGLEFVLVELPKFKPASIAEKKMNILWLRFLKEIEDSKYIEPAPELMEDEHIRKAIELCEEGAYTDAEMYAYDRYWDMIRTEKSVHSNILKQGLTKGEEIGRAKGRAEGLAEGEEIGLEKGMAKGEEIGIVKGRAEGRAEGLAEGEEIGIEKGRVKERAESMEKVKENIVRSFKNNISITVISSITGFSEEEIIAILKSRNIIIQN
ncbi:MAG: Rpn family recombination-promoting nuclease/putative transposase [Prevotellaceae bacterium]|jgi:predicted transposase/invertase (TIGR01784 family)|nr:Rpn family recombination-promoting nuclease/putative transposase [Prevotellaceae bacterium]